MAVITSASNVQWTGIGDDGFDIADSLRLLVARNYGLAAHVRNGNFGNEPISGVTATNRTIALGDPFPLVMTDDLALTGTLKVVGSNFNSLLTVKVTSLDFTSTSHPGEKATAKGTFDGTGPAPTGTEILTEGTFTHADGHKLTIKAPSGLKITTSPYSFEAPITGTSPAPITSLAVTIDGHTVTLTGSIGASGYATFDPVFTGTITGVTITQGTTVVYSATGLTAAASALGGEFDSVAELLAALNATNDIVNGNASANYVEGGGGADTLNGMAGADTIDGGAGNDSVDGGLDGDTYLESAGDDAYAIAQAGDAVQENGGSGADTVRVALQTSGYLDISEKAFLEHVVYTGTGAVTIKGNAEANSLTGGASNDTLAGAAGNDTLSGGVGADSMAGGEGDDTYIVDNANDKAIEAADGGSDTVVTASNVTLEGGSAIENLTLSGTATSVTGNTGNNKLTGNASANTLAGGGGNDTLEGGAGADVYVIDGDDTVTEIAGATGGTDLVKTSVDYSLGAYIENATLTAAAARLTGNELGNTLTGGTGADTLDGGTGNDSMAGAGGDDLYVVDAPGDKVIEVAGGGTDIVLSSVTWSLGVSQDSLVLGGSGSINGTGNADANTMQGNSGANSLDGGLGNDSYIESAGNDIYVIAQAADSIDGGSGDGADTVRVAIAGSTYLDLSEKAFLEHVVFTGTGAVAIKGNAEANSLAGGASNDTLLGNAGADTLNGGTGADSMVGGDGDDTYVVDHIADVTSELGTGNDTVISTAAVTLAGGSTIENVTLSGTATSATGNTGDNKLVGNASANTLTGGGGNDTLEGGAGADVYVIDGGDAVTEIAGATGGTDLVRTSVDYSLGAYIENATITGTTGRLLAGNELGNTLAGGTGADTLDGGTGNDSMAGGAGDDVYVVDALLDKVTEATAQGTDTVRSSVTFTLGTAVDNLTLTGEGSINGVGNGDANRIEGNAGANSLDGGLGNDSYIESAGNDVYVIAQAADSIDGGGGSGADTVRVALAGNTYLDISEKAFLEHVVFTGTGAVTLKGNAEANSLAGAAGNDTLTGGAGADTLNGGAGADSMVGGDGDDIYFIDNAGDKANEDGASGTDTVVSTLAFTLGTGIENGTLSGTATNVTGNSGNNVLVGNASANTLAGGGGNDTLEGGAGADVYIVDGGDMVTEIAGTTGGIDLVRTSVDFVLGANVENATLTAGAGKLTGNELANTLAGGTGADTLDGGSGNDSMAGGLGDDIYMVDAAGDKITEATGAGTGTDTVRAAVTFSLAASALNVENLVLTGAGNIHGTGNIGANAITGNEGANSLIGGDGADTLDGGAGNDTLIGGAGNDLYVYGTSDDALVEALNAGTDTVTSSTASVTFLAANLENIQLGGALDLAATGNSGANLITGNSGANTLNGGTGNDTLVGGAGNDYFVVESLADSLSDSSGIDTVESAVSYSLATDFENLVLATGATTGTGNASANALTGNAGANSLSGGAGNDTLTGDAGADSLAGGAGADQLLGGNDADVFVWDADDVSVSGGSGNDTLRVEGSGVEVDLTETTVALAGIETIDLTGSGNNSLVIDEASIEQLGAIQVVGNSGDSVSTTDHGWSLAGTSGGFNTYTNGTASFQVETDVTVVLLGAGNDTYNVPGDEVAESANAGTDLVNASIDYSLPDNVENLVLTGEGGISGTGNSLANAITGNAGSNSLSGGTGADTLTGAGGNDSFGVDNAGDLVIESAEGGTDFVYSSVDYSLVTNVEHLTLLNGATSGTGNSGNNSITGNSGNNSLTGGSGNDTMTGGDGNDTYSVDNVSDSVIEAGEGGTADLVSSAVDFTLPDNVEHLTLLTGATSGTGNTGNNSITGNSGNNFLVGGTGNDSLGGGSGNDTYYLDSAFDVVTEGSGAGNDTITTTSSSYTLPDNVETLLLTAGGTGTGNSGNNSITGSSIGDTLSGAAGNDSLSGAAGNDSLDGGSGIDTLDGGDGNDLIVWDPSDSIVGGGSGNDTLCLSGSNEELALNTVDTTITSIEAIDITGSGDNVLAVTAATITSIGGGTLRVSGNDGDRVVIVDTGLANDSANGANQDSQNPWSHTGTTGGIATYTNGSVTLEVEDDVEVFMLNAMLDNAFVHYQDFRYPAFGFRELGQSAGDSAGAAIAAGDINGDGLDDFVTLASDNTVYHGAETIEGTGSAYVIFGDDRTGFDRNSTLVGFDGVNGFRIDGMVEDAEMEDVAVDDLNGDGYADIVIAAMKGAASVGHVYVIFGKADFTVDLSVTTETVVDVPGATFETSYLSVEDLDGTNGFTLTADGTSHSVAIGDVTGDGRNDLIVGSPNEKWVNPIPQSTQEGDGNEGLVYVVYGKSTWAASATLNDDMAANFGERLIGTIAPSTGSSSSNWFAGGSVATADVNNDGLADVVIGQSGAMSTLSSQGFVHVVDATAINRPGDDYDFFNELFLLFDTELGIDRFDGESAGADLGEAVESAGDVNGDGYEDIIFGARFQGGGAAYVIFGGSGPFSPAGLGSLDGTKGFKITSATVDDGLGGAVSAAGDVNGDGYGDVLVGAPSFEHNDTATFMNVRAGQAYVIYGKASWAGSFSVADLNGANGFTFQTTQNLSDRTGGAAAAAGDLDGDGFGDFLIGAPSGSPSSNNNQTQKGYTFVFYGGDLNGAVDQVGDVVDPEEEEPTYADSLSGDAGKDNIVAGLGNDTIDAGGGSDAVHGGAGNDRIIVSDDDFRLVDGGSGTDTFVFEGSGLSIDLTAIGNLAITGIEAFDLTGTGNNTLKLARTDLFALSKTTDQLTVDGNTGDTLDLSEAIDASHWVPGATTGGYTMYTYGIATLQVGEFISVL